MNLNSSLNIFGNIRNSNLLKVAFGLRETSLVMIIILASIIMSILSPHFLSSSNLSSVGVSLVTDGIIAIGMTVALVSGNFDLSVGSVMGLSSVVASVLYVYGLDIWTASAIAIGVGMMCGFVNGLFVGKLGLNPFITTLAMMGIARGLAYIFTQGSPIPLSGVSEAFSYLGRGVILGIPVSLILLAFIAFVVDYMMRRSEPFRKVYYIGSNEKAAILSGINISRTKMAVFLLTAFLSSVAGIIALSRFGVATPTTGDMAELRAIAAAVIGGTSLRGGEGSVFGAVLGVCLLAIINNGLVLMNVSVYWQQFVTFSILLLAVTIDHISHRRKMA